MKQKKEAEEERSEEKEEEEGEEVSHVSSRQWEPGSNVGDLILAFLMQKDMNNE